MKLEFDAGYSREPFRTLVAEYPGTDVYPTKDFRVEWGPVFHRGRLDGSARILIIGQDPAAHEAIARRILVGEAGQRIQGFLSRLGIERSYVMVNAFLYSVYGQQGGEKHRKDAAIAGYRNRWLDALLLKGKVKAVVALGALAEEAWKQWAAGHKVRAGELVFVRVYHPTWPESSSGGSAAKRAAAVAKMLENWNRALAVLSQAGIRQDRRCGLVPYGSEFTTGDLQPIPEADLPAGMPEWMRQLEEWASRTGKSAKEKRRTITVQIPERYMP